MMKELLAAWLRPACAFLGFAGILILAGCGGGSGAPNNPYAPVPPPIPQLVVLPDRQTLYPGTPATLTVYGGVPPYRAFSSDQATVPVATNVSGSTIVLAANPVNAGILLELTVQDSAGTRSSPVAITVQPTPLLSTQITINGNPNPNCDSTTNTICSGGTGSAVVKVMAGTSFVGVPNRPVRWDVVQGNFSLVSTNPAQPLVSTLTTVSDANGNATVVLAVPADTPTQTGILRATDTTTGNQVTGPFLIQQVTVNGDVLAVLPQGTTTITGPDSSHCSSGVTLNYYIFGGTPPYSVATGFPQALALAGVPVTKNGGSFTATTNGTCFENATFVIRDAVGNVIPSGSYPTITNELGSGSAPPVSTPLIVTPGAIAKNNCVPANTFQFIGTGGITPYSAVITSSTSPTTPTLSPQTGINQGQAVQVANLTSPSSTTITLFDNSSPRQSGVVTIDCSGGPSPPTPPALLVTPGNYNFTQPPPASPGTCVNQTFNFTITGASPPYSVFFAPPRPGGLIIPATVAQSGQGFSVTGLTNGILTTNITISDSSTPAVQSVVTITCPAATPPAPLSLSPGVYTYIGEDQCRDSMSVFSVGGGTPPYTIFFSTPGTQGLITPTLLPAAGTFTVSGLLSTGLPRSTSITVTDSSAATQFQTVLIDCRPR